jgi:hypothetical protein
MMREVVQRDDLCRVATPNLRHIVNDNVHHLAWRERSTDPYPVLLISLMARRGQRLTPQIVALRCGEY